MEEKKTNKASEIAGAAVKKIVNFIILLVVIGLLGVVAWFWHNSQLDKQRIDILEEKINSESKVENSQDLEVKKDDLRAVEESEVSNVENFKTTNKEIDDSAISTKDSSELKVYKNEKYKYSFKYPKDWYIYEDKDFSKCYDQEISGGVGESNVFLSRNKKDLCEVGFGVMGSSFGGDIYIEIYQSEDDNYPFNIKKEESRESGLDNYKIGAVNGYMHRFIASRVEGEVFLKNFAKIYARKNGYDYEIGIRQLDDKGNIDPALMEVVDSFIIEK